MQAFEFGSGTHVENHDMVAGGNPLVEHSGAGGLGSRVHGFGALSAGQGARPVPRPEGMMRDRFMLIGW
ncbi:hypothetical protein GCM10017711_26750 [Paeniglutamicibacter sulfureus]